MKCTKKRVSLERDECPISKAWLWQGVWNRKISHGRKSEGERKREGAEGEKVEGEGFSQRREEAQVGRERNTEE